MANFNNDIAFSELAWQNDSYAREISQRNREERDMQDWQILSEEEEEEAAAARAAVREAAFEASLPVASCCDGSGVVEETYVGVDQTFVVACKGCPACDLAAAEEVQQQFLGDDREEPEWMRDPEVVEFGVVAR